MGDDFKQTVRIVRQKKVRTDGRGRTVWNEPIEETALDLVSTAELRQVLNSQDEDRKHSLRDAAAGKDGVLAVHRDTDKFEIVDDDDVQVTLTGKTEGASATEAGNVRLVPVSSLADTDDDELSLVSTRALRRILDPEDVNEEDNEDDPQADTGFDPYDSA